MNYEERKSPRWLTLTVAEEDCGLVCHGGGAGQGCGSLGETKQKGITAATLVSFRVTLFLGRANTVDS
ncbi:hypothetical protein AMECASPLE_012977 [Ameca splendens]|uniref:Uncharacterized protein n=1 Tax=Ameca splendens TaxID=208324 RepID=A0ABV0XQ97_9TELE